MSTLIDHTSINGFGCLEQAQLLLNIHPSHYYDLETLNTHTLKEGYSRLETDETPTSVPFASKHEIFKEWIELLNVSLLTPLFYLLQTSSYGLTTGKQVSIFK